MSQSCLVILMGEILKNTRLVTFYTIVPTRPTGIYVIFNIKIGLKYFDSKAVYKHNLNQPPTKILYTYVCHHYA